MNGLLFVGWLSPLGRNQWRKVAASTDYKTAWTLTLAASTAGDNDLIVREGERHPNDRKRPR